MSRSMSCGQTQREMSAFLAGGTGQRERAALFAHTRRCARCASALDDLVAASVALDRAYAPLRGRTARISPSRVRLAARIPAPVPMAVRFNRVTARVAELGLAAAVTAFAFIGSGSVAPAPTIIDEAAPIEQVSVHVSHSLDDQYFWRWIRLGRYAPQADDLDAAAAPRALHEDVAPIAHERAGLLR